MTTQTIDPDVPVLRKALATLQAMVARKEITPRDANSQLGSLAAGLVRSREQDRRDSATPHRRRRA